MAQDQDIECNDYVDESCDSCGSTEDVSEDSNGELLCPDCADEAWF